ncbi:hypothetical protein LQV63_28195 [Paenibacillus profundus]|uniref:Uncharacterized protein n=1 Tax=Paenibacillus profundus TaxID=1173085 RepID=A0ABS8YMV0_9BACL|nr:hypothetical protein [Paenibacillus profundus]MCE5173148.1 hypothetical protein [Paenibacillus profundus]
MKKMISKLCIAIITASLLLLPTMANGYESVKHYHAVTPGDGPSIPWSKSGTIAAFSGGDVIAPW